MEREKLIDTLFATYKRQRVELSDLKLQLERLTEEYRKANESYLRMEARAIAAEERAHSLDKTSDLERLELQEKIDRLLSLVDELRNEPELKLAVARAEKAEKELASLVAANTIKSGKTYRATEFRRKKQ